MDDDDDVRHVRRTSVIHYGSLADNASGGVKRKAAKDDDGGPDDDGGGDVDEDGVSSGNVQRSTEYMALESATDLAGLGKEEMLQGGLSQEKNNCLVIFLRFPKGKRKLMGSLV